MFTNTCGCYVYYNVWLLCLRGRLLAMTHLNLSSYQMLRFPASLSNIKSQSPVISDIGSIEAVFRQCWRQCPWKY